MLAMRYSEVGGGALHELPVELVIDGNPVVGETPSVIYAVFAHFIIEFNSPTTLLLVLALHLYLKSYNFHQTT